MDSMEHMKKFILHKNNNKWLRNKKFLKSGSNNG